MLILHYKYSPKMKRITLKRKSCALFAFAFTIVLLSYSSAVAGNKDFWKDLAKGIAEGVADDAKQNAKREKEKEFDKKIDVLLKKLPADARLFVLETKVEAPELPEKESFESVAKRMQDNLEEHFGALGLTVVDRDAFREIEKEIVYSQTGEVDPSNSAKFGKAVGATHLLISKIVYDGFATGHPTATFSIKITEVASSIRIGTVNVTFDVDQPRESATFRNSQKETLVNESFTVGPGDHKDYAWNFNRAGTLNINLTANADIFLYVVDNENYAAYAGGGEFRGFAIKKRITSANFSVSVLKGLNYLVIHNAHILKSAGIGLSVLYTPMQ